MLVVPLGASNRIQLAVLHLSLDFLFDLSQLRVQLILKILSNILTTNLVSVWARSLVKFVFKIIRDSKASAILPVTDASHSSGGAPKVAGVIQTQVTIQILPVTLRLRRLARLGRLHRIASGWVAVRDGVLRLNWLVLLNVLLVHCQLRTIPRVIVECLLLSRAIP